MREAIHSLRLAMSHSEDPVQVAMAELLIEIAEHLRGKVPQIAVLEGVLRHARNPTITGHILRSALDKDIVADLFVPVEHQDQRVAYIVMCPDAYQELRRIGREVDLDIECNAPLIQQGIMAYLYGATVLVHRGNFGITMVGERAIRKNGARIGTEWGVVFHRPWPTPRTTRMDQLLAEHGMPRGTED